MLRVTVNKKFSFSLIIQYKRLQSKYLSELGGLKVPLHIAIFLATCNATNVALQVARKIHVQHPILQLQLLRCELQEKVERPSTFRNVARQVACV